MKNEVDEVESMPNVEPSHGGELNEPKKEVMISVRALRIAAGVVVLLLVLYFAKGLFVAAVVNGHPISRLEVIHQLEKSSGKATLDSLITRSLIADAAKKKGVTVTKDEVATEIKKIEAQIAASGQGATLDMVLTNRGMTREDLEMQITLQKEVEKLVADKIAVSDAEVDQYIKENKITLPKGEEAADRAQIKDQIQQQKLTIEGQAYIESLHSDSSIRYFVKY